MSKLVKWTIILWSSLFWIQCGQPIEPQNRGGPLELDALEQADELSKNLPATPLPSLDREETSTDQPEGDLPAPPDTLPHSPQPPTTGKKILSYKQIPATSGYAEHIQQGALLNAKAFYDVLSNLKPESCEKDIKERIHRIFADGGSDGTSFDTITASGPNALTLHYKGSDRCLRDGEMIKIDIGSRLGTYASDVTRTFPANGKFTARQKEIYQLVLDAQQAVVEFTKPNVHSLAQAHAFVRDFFRKSPLRAKDSNGQSRTMDHFFTHSLNHYIGKNVHGKDFQYSHFDPLVPGRVIAMEPGIYIESEKFGIRIEDDFIVEQDQIRNLNPNLIVEIDDIEAFMAGDLEIDERIKESINL